VRFAKWLAGVPRRDRSVGFGFLRDGQRPFRATRLLSVPKQRTGAGGLVHSEGTAFFSIGMDVIARGWGHLCRRSRGLCLCDLPAPEDGDLPRTGASTTPRRLVAAARPLIRPGRAFNFYTVTSSGKFGLPLPDWRDRWREGREEDNSTASKLGGFNHTRKLDRFRIWWGPACLFPNPCTLLVRCSFWWAASGSFSILGLPWQQTSSRRMTAERFGGATPLGDWHI